MNIDDRAAWIILEAYRRQCGLTGYVHESNRALDVERMKGALAELRLTEVVRHVAD